MKYELVALSMNFRGKLYRIEDKPVFVSNKDNEKELDACYKDGYIKPIGTKAKNPNEVQEQYLKDAESQKQKESEKKQVETEKQIIEGTKNKIMGIRNDLEEVKISQKVLDKKESDAKKKIEGLEGKEKEEAEKTFKLVQEENNKAKAAILNTSKQLKQLEDSLKKMEK